MCISVYTVCIYILWPHCTVYVYIRMYVYIYIYGNESKPCARRPVPTALCYKGMKRGACYILFVAACRAASNDYKQSCQWEVCRDRRLPVTYPMQRGMSRVWAPAHFGFDQLPYICICACRYACACVYGRRHTCTHQAEGGSLCRPWRYVYQQPPGPPTKVATVCPESPYGGCSGGLLSNGPAPNRPQ